MVIIYIGIGFVVLGVIFFIVGNRYLKKAEDQHDYFLNTQKDFQEYQEFKEDMF